MLTKPLPPEPLAYSIEEIIQLSRIGKTTIYAEIKDGRLKTTKVRRRTIILAEDARAWLASWRSAS